MYNVHIVFTNMCIRYIYKCIYNSNIYIAISLSSQPTVNSSSNKQPQEVVSTTSPSLPPSQVPPTHSYPQHRPQKPSPAPVSVSAAAANMKRLELQKKSQSLLESQIQQQKVGGSYF